MDRCPPRLQRLQLRGSEGGTKGEVVVCFLDILGFEKRSRTKPQKAETDIDDFHSTLLDCILGKKTKTQVGRRYYQRPQFSVISDAVFVCLPLVPDKETATNDAELLIRGIGNALYECIEKNIPLRGSLSVGHTKMHAPRGMDGTVLVGSPVTEAASFEEKQEWLGISFVPEISQEHYVLKELKKRNAILEWPVPTLSGLQDLWAVTWPEASLQFAIERVEKCYLRYLCGFRREKQDTGVQDSAEEMKPDLGAAAKYLSTLVFLNHLLRYKSRNDWQDNWREC